MVYPISGTANVLRTTRDTEYGQQLYSRPVVKAQPTAQPPDFSQLFANVDRAAADGGAAAGLQSYLDELNQLRSQDLNAVYDSSGTTYRVTSNTILVGYG